MSNNSFFKKSVIAVIFGYILSAPVLIWKGSKMGRIIFILAMISLTSFAITKISKPIYDVYFNFKTAERVVSFIVELGDAQEEVEEFKEIIARLETELRDKSKAKIYTVQQEYRGLFSDLEYEAEDLRKSLKIIREEQRAEIKERLIIINERIKVLNESVDDANNRRELELIASNIKLLNQDEKRRLYSELERIGFKIKEYEKNYYITSGHTISPIGWW